MWIKVAFVALVLGLFSGCGGEQALSDSQEEAEQSLVERQFVSNGSASRSFLRRLSESAGRDAPRNLNRRNPDPQALPEASPFGLQVPPNLPEPSLSPSLETSGSAASSSPTLHLEHDRLYYVNPYRGLQILDVSDPAQPALLGTSALWGRAVHLEVNRDVALLAVAQVSDRFPGRPANTLVRLVDAGHLPRTKVLAEVELLGIASYAKRVEDRLYLASVEYASLGSYDVVERVWSLRIEPDRITVLGSMELFRGSIYHSPTLVSGDQGLLALKAIRGGPLGLMEKIEVCYFHLSDPSGKLVPGGRVELEGPYLQQIDFSPDQRLRVLRYRPQPAGLLLSIVDFGTPDAPVVLSDTALPSTGPPDGQPVFQGNRLYVSLAQHAPLPSGPGPSKLHIYDLSDPKEPRFAAELPLSGTLQSIAADGPRLFANTRSGVKGENILELHYLDVGNPSQPKLIGSARVPGKFYGGMHQLAGDSARSLLAFGVTDFGSTNPSTTYRIQLFEYSDTAIWTRGSAFTPGFVSNTLFHAESLWALGETFMSALDVKQPSSPRLASERPLAHDVRAVTLRERELLELSVIDNGGISRTRVRNVPLSRVGREIIESEAAVFVNGYPGPVFHNGDLSYLVNIGQNLSPCTPETPDPGPDQSCVTYSLQVSVLDHSSGEPKLRTSVLAPSREEQPIPTLDRKGLLPTVAQLRGNVLGVVYSAGESPMPNYQALAPELLVVDLEDPDSPRLSWAKIADRPGVWAGNLRVIADSLYVQHSERVDPSATDPDNIRYYLDRIDVSDPARPEVSHSFNVPGLVVGVAPDAPNTLYTLDFKGGPDEFWGEVNAIRVRQRTLTSLGKLALPKGWIDKVLVHRSQIHVLVHSPATDPEEGEGQILLCTVDLSDPSQPTLSTSENPVLIGSELLGIAGDRALMQWRGESEPGLNLFRFQNIGAPTHDRFVDLPDLIPGNEGFARRPRKLFVAQGWYGLRVLDLE